MKQILHINQTTYYRLYGLVIIAILILNTNLLTCCLIIKNWRQEQREKPLII